MAHEDRSLALAGTAAVASLLLASAAVTIAVIAAVSPPLSQYLDAAQNAREAVRARWLWPVAALGLVGGVWSTAQVVLRCPILTSERSLRKAADAGVAFMILSLLAAACAVWSIATGVVSIRHDTGHSITDSMSFGGMSLTLGVLACILGSLSVRTFATWWCTGNRETRQATDA
jgi:hypothetical protein